MNHINRLSNEENEFKTVYNFVYLGSEIDSNGACDMRSEY